MINRDSDEEGKSVHVSLRVDENLRDFYDELANQWSEEYDEDYNRSDVIRVLSKGFMGAMYGRLIGIVDPGKLREKGGTLGDILVNNMQDEKKLPEEVADLRLADLISDPMVLVGAAETELEEVRNGNKPR